MIPFIDLKKQYENIESRIRERVDTVLNHGQYIMGPEVQELESVLAEYCGTQHCIGVASGTDALQIALMALGIGSGDEVIIPDFTFFATAEVVALLGAKPVFVDVDSKSYNIDPARIEEKISKKTKAIIPVSLFGQCADFDEINEIANTNGLFVIEDGAQSFGASYKGKKSLSLSKIGCTSFFPSKPLGAYGDGGACFTDDTELASKMRQLRIHGQSQRYTHSCIGINGRLDTIQAAILLEKIKIFDSEFQARQTRAKKYNIALAEKFITPHVCEGNISAYAQYTIQVDNRDGIIKSLKNSGIPTAVHYPIPVSSQPVFHDLKSEPKENSRKLSERVISLPMHPYLNEKDQDVIIKKLLDL